MEESRPRLTPQEVFDLYIALGTVIEVKTEDIETANGESEIEYYSKQIDRFCDLYIKLRALTGHTAAARHRVTTWKREREDTIKRWGIGRHPA